MKARLGPPVTPVLSDEAAEQVRREHDRAIRELQRLPLADAVVINDVSLASGVDTPVSHKLGRKPRMVYVSPPRGPSSTGRIEEMRTGLGALQRDQVVVLKATGWGATIAVDVMVW